MGYLEMSLWSQMSKVMAIYLAVTVSYIHTQLLYHFLYAPLARKHISLPAVPKVKSGPSVQCTCRSFNGQQFPGLCLAVARLDTFSTHLLSFGGTDLGNSSPQKIDCTNGHFTAVEVILKSCPLFALMTSLRL